MLKGVVDGDWKGRVSLLAQAVQSLSHPMQEEGFRFLLAPVAVRCGYQFLGLRHGHRCKEVGEN